MNLVILILVIIVIVYFSVKFIYKRFINTLKLKRLFNKLSIVVCGKRGKGKDITFSYIARKKEHNSNIVLQPNTHIIKLEDLIIKDLTRENLIKNNFEPKNRANFKHFDNITLISDAGIYFPNWDENKLKYEYKELPITWAIWRHLFDNGCHFNIQKCGRLWKLLREQIEDVLEIQDLKIGRFYFEITYIHYERLEDAEKGLLPINNGFLKKKENIIVENSKRGNIETLKVLIPKKYIKHDEKYFRKVVFYEEEN